VTQNEQEGISSLRLIAVSQSPRHTMTSAAEQNPGCKPAGSVAIGSLMINNRCGLLKPAIKARPIARFARIVENHRPHRPRHVRPFRSVECSLTTLFQPDSRIAGSQYVDPLKQFRQDRLSSFLAGNNDADFHKGVT